MSPSCKIKSGNQVGITKTLKCTIHIIASLFVPLIMVMFLILTALQMAIGGIGGRVKKSQGQPRLEGGGKLEKRAKKAIVTGLLVFMMALGCGTQVTPESTEYLITALIAGVIAACLVYLKIAKPEEVLEVKRKRGRPRKKQE